MLYPDAMAAKITRLTSQFKQKLVFLPDGVRDRRREGLLAASGTRFNMS